MTTTTTLIHRVYNGPLEWWRDGLVYEIGSLDIGAADLEAAHGVLDHVASLGFNVVLVRPSRVPIDGDLSSFRSFAGRAHELGLRVITRISGALGPVTGAHAHDAGPIFTGQERGREGLMERAAAFLAEGADGVDLGTIVPPHISAETDLGLLSERFAILQALVAEHVDDGLIGAWGVSNFDPADMGDLADLGVTPATNQILYNLLRRGPEYDLLPLMRERGVELMAYSPLEQGRLFQGQAGKLLSEIAAEAGTTPAALALAWAVREPGSIAIPRTSSPERMEENASALQVTLTPEILRDLDEVFTPPSGPRPLEIL